MIDRIKVGDVLMDGFGVKQTVISLDGLEDMPVVTKSREGISTYRSNGQFQREGTSTFDLILPKRTRTITRWVNVYPCGETDWDDKDDAIYNAEVYSSEEIALAVAVPVTFTVEY